MRKNMPYMVLDITKKPGDPNAVKTGDMLLAENTKLREALESIASNLEHRLFARYPSSASDEWMYQKANAALAATEKEGGAK